MQYAYAAYLLARSGAEIDGANLFSLLGAAHAAMDRLQVNATVAALESVDVGDGVIGGIEIAAPGSMQTRETAAVAPDDLPFGAGVEPADRPANLAPICAGDLPATKTKGS